MSERHKWDECDVDAIPTCDWCDDDTDAVLGVPYTLEVALSDDWRPGQSEVCLCVGHCRILHMGVRDVLEELGDAVKPD